MLSLPIYRRCNTFYLHTRVNGKQFKRSLKTSSKIEAIIKASFLISEIRNMKIDLKNIRSYHIDLHNGRFEAKDASDHQRLLEALAVIQGLQNLKPQPQSNTPTTSGVSFETLFKKFLKLKKFSASTIKSYSFTAREFVTVCSNKDINLYTKKDISIYREFLVEKGNSIRTTDNKINYLNIFFNFAIQNGDMNIVNPASGFMMMTKSQKTSNGYDFFQEQEVGLLFKSSYFLEQRNDDPDYYWACLLAVITGCRTSEICSLKFNQFSQSKKGLDFFTIFKGKTNSASRTIPLSKKFMDSGFRDFLLAAKNNPEGKLFKYKEREDSGSGNAVGKKFKRHLELLRILDNERKLVFHSLRKFCNTYLAQNGVNEVVRCQLLGHKPEGTNAQVYTNTFNIDEVWKIIAPIIDELEELLGIGFDT